MDKVITTSAPSWLRRLGVQSWLFIGFVLAAIVILVILATLDQIVTPLMISTLLAILFRPVVDWLEQHILEVDQKLGEFLKERGVTCLEMERVEPRI